MRRKRKVNIEVWVHYNSVTGYVWPQIYRSEKDAYLDEKLNYPVKTMKLVTEKPFESEQENGPCDGSFGHIVPVC